MDALAIVKLDGQDLERMRAGSADAFPEIVERHFGAVFGIALARLGDRESAEDLAQEVFLRAWLARNSLRNPLALRAWLGRITRNLAATWRERNQRASRLLPLIPLEELAVEPPDSRTCCPREAAAAGEEETRMRQALTLLPVELRETLTLYYGEGLTKADIARLTGVHETSVARRLDRALGELRTLLTAPVPEERIRQAATALRATRRGVARAGAFVMAAAALPPEAGAALATAAGPPAAGFMLSAGLLAGIGKALAVAAAAGLIVVAARTAGEWTGAPPTDTSISSGSGGTPPAEAQSNSPPVPNGHLAFSSAGADSFPPPSPAEDAAITPAKDGNPGTVPIDLLTSGGLQTASATLVVEKDATGAAQGAHLLARTAPGTRMFRVNADGLPEELRRSLNLRDILLFSPPVYARYEFEPARLDLRRPQSGTRGTTMPESVRLVDAAGRPAAGMQVEFICQGLACYSHILGPDGVFPVYYPQTSNILAQMWSGHKDPSGRPVMEPMTSTRLNDQIGSSELRIVNPQSEEQCRILFPQYHFRQGARQGTFVDPVALPILAPEGKGEDIAPAPFFGTVFDENGRPVSGASVSGSWLRLPGVGTGGVQLTGIAPSAVTDSKGRFELRPPPGSLEGSLGQDGIPDGARLQVTAVWQAGTSSPRRRQFADLIKGQETRIDLPYCEPLRFRFVDEEGNCEMTKAGIRNLSGWVLLRRKDAPAGAIWRQRHLNLSARSENEGILDVGPVPLPGEYEAEFQGKRYASRRLEPGAEGAVVEWKPQVGGEAVYSGRLVHVQTGQPVAGACLLLTSSSDAAWTLGTTTEEVREDLWHGVPADGRAYPVPPGFAKKVSERPGGSLGMIAAVGRADGSGRFRLVHPAGQKAQHLIVAASGMIPLRVEADTVTGNEREAQGEFSLGDAPMIPAVRVIARVEAPPLLPDEFLRPEVERLPEELLFNSGVRFSATGWAVEAPLLNPTPDRPWRAVTASSWNRAGSDFLLLAPGGVPFSVWAANAREAALKPLQWPETSPTAGGTEIRLPSRAFELKRPCILQILRADGSPAAGVPVHVEGNVPRTTDAQGELTVWVDGETLSRITVPLPDSQRPVERTNLPVPPGESVPRLEIRLP